MTEPRARRNRNPGNLRILEGQSWQGAATPEQMTPEQAKEKTFVVFVNFIYGFRALAVLLRNYQTKHGLSTIQGILGRFAPINENDTDAYVKHVCDITGFDKSQSVNLLTPGNMRALCKAIAIHEAGSWCYELGDLISGVSLALTSGHEDLVA